MEQINNFLDERDFALIENTFTNSPRLSDIAWFYSTKVGTETEIDDLNHSYFIHTLYDHHASRSDLLNVIQPLLKKLEVKSLIRAKVNLFLRTEQLYKFDLHQDYPFEANAAILYLNTCNGGTFFEDKENPFTQSVRNRLLKFKTNEAHQSTSCTDRKFRMLINLNYF
jgi:hypothetical protein